MVPFSADTLYTFPLPPRPTKSILVYILSLTRKRTERFLLCAAPAALVAVSTTDIFGGGGGA
jgi:hypothetical protein